MECRQRVEGFKFPRIYRIFRYIDQYSEETTNYAVVDLTPERFEDAIDFLIKYFLPYEALNEYIKIPENHEAVEEYKNEWRHFLSQRVSLVCFKENCSDIIGLNIMFIKTRQHDLIWVL